MLTELVKKEQIEEYELGEYADMEMSIERLEKILDDIYKKQKLKGKNIKVDQVLLIEEGRRLYQGKDRTSGVVDLRRRGYC